MYFTEKCRGQLQPANNMVWYVYHLQWILYVACTRLKLEQLKRLGAAVGCHRGSDEMMATRQLFQLDRSQSLFYFVPQEKGLMWRPPWGWKNMGESILH